MRNEFEIGENEPDEILSERMWSTAYLWHNYGKSTIGSRADIEKVPATTLKRFYKKYYRPDNAVLIVAGKFDPAAALALIGTSFGGARQPADRRSSRRTPSSRCRTASASVTLRRTGDVQVVGLVYHVVGRAPIAGLPGRRGDRRDPDRRAVGPALRRAGQDRPRDLGEREPPAAPRSGRARAVGDRAGRQADRRRARQDDRDRRGPREVEDHRRGGRALQGQDQDGGSSCAFSNSAQLGIALSEYDRRRRLAPPVPPPRSRRGARPPPTSRRSPRPTSSPSNRTLGMFLPTKTPERAPLEGDARRRASWSRATRASRPRPRARSSTPRSTTSRSAPPARRSPPA